MHPLLAHGVGGREDLPIPFGWAVAGAAIAVIVSFVALGALWKTPKITSRTTPTTTRMGDGENLTRVARVLGLVIFLYVALCLVFGKDDANNPLPWLVYVYLWVGLVVVSVILGPVWRRLNPLRTIHDAICRIARLEPAEGVRRLSPSIGYWPSAVGLFAFTWMELVDPDNNTLLTFRVAIGLYCLVHLLAAFVYGSAWFDRGDAFETWSDLFGRIRIHSPFAGLDALTPAPGLVATVMVMLGSTAYDGFSGSTNWQTFIQVRSHPQLIETFALLGTIVLLSLLYVAATAIAGVVGGVGRRGMPAAFAHSVVPVALGYVIAHYYSLFVLEGQRGLAELSDPLSTGANWFGTAHLTPNPAPLNPTLVASVQVGAVVIGHILGVVLAHDRAVRLFPRARAVVGQIPLLVLMVTLTCTGLLLLFAT